MTRMYRMSRLENTLADNGGGAPPPGPTVEAPGAAKTSGAPPVATKTSGATSGGPALVGAALPTHVGDPFAVFLGQTLAAMFLALNAAQGGTRGGVAQSVAGQSNPGQAGTQGGGNGRKGDGNPPDSGPGGPPPQIEKLET